MSPEITSEAAELSEAETLFDFEAAAPPDVRSALGMSGTRTAGGVVLGMHRDSSGFWSKTLGLGFARPVSGELIGEVLDFYRAHDVPSATIQLAPSVLPPDWEAVRAEHGLTESAPWVKLVCETDRALRTLAADGARPSSIRAVSVAPADAAAWSDVLLGVFGMTDEPLKGMVEATVGRDGWFPFAGMDDDEIVATGTLHVHDGVAQFFAGATLERARGRGAQSALLAARARAAKAAGCQWLVAETGAEAPGTHNSSLHNMRRLGFRVLYERRNFVWNAAPGA